MLESFVKGRLRLKPRRDTREAILNAAEELLQRRGYNAFSYQHIAVQLGIRNAAIHYHFPGKEDLGVALVRRFRQRFRDWALSVEPLPDAWARLQAFIDSYAAYLTLEDMPICPIGVLGAEFGAIPEPMRQEARLFLREHYEWLSDTLQQGREDGSLQFEGDARGRAVAVGATLQGAVQIARMAGAMRFHQVVDELSVDLRRA